ncbi:hypothetical protein CP532_5647 [Ophiocordyceps camponoti-leonardi (nom. inval.)]|nr:hypothetical protein CP532_5647 [Ophiocordyceps camponoti-leonardi (nom. inval.)]
MKTILLLLAISMSGYVQALPPYLDLEQSSASAQPQSSDQSFSTQGLVHLFDAFASKSPPIPQGASLTPIRLSPEQKVAIMNACRHMKTTLRPIKADVDLVCIDDKSSLDKLESLLRAKASGLPVGHSIQQINSAVLQSCLKQQNDQYVPENFDVYCIEQKAIDLAMERREAKETILEDLLFPKFNSTSRGIIKGPKNCIDLWFCLRDRKLGPRFENVDASCTETVRSWKKR